MNKTWKELLCMVLSAVMVLGLAACGSSKAEASAGDGDSTSGDTAADSIVLKMSTAQPEEHIASQTALRFADLIEQGTNGAVTTRSLRCRVFPLSPPTSMRWNTSSLPAPKCIP